MFNHIKIFKQSTFQLSMSNSKETQVVVEDVGRVKIHQLGIDGDSYDILTSVKNQLINKFKGKKVVTYSDSIRELQRRSKEKK